MEADWEVELGGGARVIEPLWPGFVDLRRDPDRAYELQEVSQLPLLAGILVRLNGAESPVWTSKCDVWPVADFDLDELDAPREAALHAVACYVDLLPRGDQHWDTQAATAAWCRNICALLRALPMRSCRADLIVRHAMLFSDRTNLGITAYLSACGPTPGNASDVLAAALAVFADSIAPEARPESAASKLQWGHVGE